VSVVASLLHSLRFVVRSRAALHLEIVALRHQLAVTSRSRRPRLRLTALDRVLWAWLAHRWRGWRSALHVVQPATVLAWHRRGFRLFWTWKSRHRMGGGLTRCPRVNSRDVNGESTVGCAAHSRELLKLGISVGEAADLFVVPTVTFRLLFVLVILAHDQRRIVHVAVTEHPTAAWTAQQLRNAFSENESPQYLLHDRDSFFAHVATTMNNYR
jgi:putative transposase